MDCGDELDVKCLNLDLFWGKMVPFYMSSVGGIVLLIITCIQLCILLNFMSLLIFCGVS